MLCDFKEIMEEEEIEDLVEPIKQKLKLWKVGDKVKYRILRRPAPFIDGWYEHKLGEITDITHYNFVRKGLDFIVDHIYFVHEEDMVKIGG